MNSLSPEHDVEAVDFLVLKRSAAVCVLGVVLAGISGCALLDTRPADAVVKERAQERWNALVRGDTKSAYEFFSPGSRAVLKYQDWDASLKKGFWKSAAVDKVVCATPESCEAHVTIEYEFRGTRTKTPLQESWVKDGRTWWYVQK